MSCQVTILVRQKKKLMWAYWVKDALCLFNENRAWDNSNVLGLFISKVIFSGIDYVQDFVLHGLMANWHLLLWKRVFSMVKGKYWKWYFTELIGMWCTEFSTSFLGLLTSKKMIIIVLMKNDNNNDNNNKLFSNFLSFCFIPSMSATFINSLLDFMWNFSMPQFYTGIFCFSLFHSRNSDFLSPQFLNHPFHSQTI